MFGRLFRKKSDAHKKAAVLARFCEPQMTTVLQKLMQRVQAQGVDVSVRDVPWSDALHGVADGAWTAAHDRGHTRIAPEHLFFALLHDDDVNAVLERAGIDVHALFDEVTLLVDTVPTTSVPADDVLLRAMWARVTSGGDDVRPIDVLVALLAHDDLRALVPLRTRNITRLSVLLALVPRPPRVVPTTAQASLVLHNDDHTSAEFVAGVLHDVVKLDPAIALVRMREVHEAGQAVVATLATAQALEVAARVEKSARARGYPLAVSLQPA